MTTQETLITLGNLFHRIGNVLQQHSSSNDPIVTSKGKQQKLSMTKKPSKARNKATQVTNLAINDNTRGAIAQQPLENNGTTEDNANNKKRKHSATVENMRKEIVSKGENPVAESETADTEGIRLSQQSRQSMTSTITEQIDGQSPNKRVFGRWNKNDDNRLIQTVEKILSEEATISYKDLINRITEEFKEWRSRNQCVSHYKSLHKEQKLPAHAPL